VLLLSTCYNVRGDGVNDQDRDAAALLDALLAPSGD
jgi:hypothetical protein